MLPLAPGEAAPDLLDRELAAEQGADVVRGAQVGLGDDRLGPRADEAGRVVVDALDGHRLGALGDARLAVAARVAEVRQHDHGVRRELHVVDRRLAEVLVVGVVGARDRVEPEAVLGRRVERVAVRAGPAVPVAEVDHDRGALERVLHRRPGRVRGVDLGHLRAGGDGLGRGGVREGPVLAREAAHRPDHEDHPRDARRGCHGRDGACGSEHPDEERDKGRASETVQRLDLPTTARWQAGSERSLLVLSVTDHTGFTGASRHRFLSRHRGPAGYHRQMADAPGQAPHTNRLAGETSPYLLQHAHNPVDWFPWGQDALSRALLLDRPIFLSIGYAACHWCHVMERESFEDEATAAALNAGFVAIKVDREERPDLDQLYMGAVQAMTGSGGWPMSVFLTPDGRPFYGGTYFPDTPRHGMPSFRQVLEGVRAAWTTQRAELEQSASRMVEALAASQALAGSAGSPSGAPPTALPGPDVLDAATAGIVASFDPANGGWGRAPKFPQPMTIEFLLRRHAAHRGAGAARGRAPEPRCDGRRWHPRPAGRRVPPLRDRRPVAGPALRADALRQRPAGPRVRARVGAHRGRGPPRGDDRGARLRRARAGDARRRVRGEPGRGHRGRGGRDLHLDRGGGSRGPGRRRRAVLRRVRRDRRGQLGGPHDPVARPRRRRAGRTVRAVGRRGRGPARGRPVLVAGASRVARPARPGRQGAGRLERPGDRRVRGRRPVAGRRGRA